MKNTNDILEIAIASPLRRSFDYLIPDDVLPERLVPGQRIQVPFGKQTQIGILIRSKTQSDFPRSKLKSAHQVLDDATLVSPDIFKLCLWASEYYHHSLGEIIHACLPTHLRKGKAAILSNTQRPIGTATDEKKHTLNPEQEDAVNTITQQERFASILLEGITGSGKTEVYLSSIESVLKRGKQAMVLVPEIGLTPQTVTRFEQRFSVPISVLHSGLTEKQRLQEWLKAQQGLSRIVIGTRSAILTSMPELGIIIIDEEHDSSFKQQSGFRYCARSMGIMRAKIANIPIVLGSATPSLESLYNVERKRYLHCVLRHRAGNAANPQYHLIDIRHKNLTQGLSPKLLDNIRQHIEADNQVLLFLNRRGFAPILLCHECGWTAECPHCDAKMTFHATTNNLHCHHCDTKRPRYPKCLSCKSTELITLGVGTEQLESALQQLFPSVPILRIDRDTTRTKDAMQEKLDHIQQGGQQILVGTQMLAKGHHFPNVTMVGIIDADSGLLSSDFRALEKLGQTLLQVAGRAGREQKRGEVFLQTHCPHNPLLQQLLKDGYGPFAKAILMQRKITQLPPYSYLVMLRAEAKHMQRPTEFLSEAKTLANQMTGHERIDIFGPIPAAMLRKGGQYRTQLLIKCTNRKTLQRWLKDYLPKLEALKSGKRLRWTIDIDPQEILQ